MRAIVLLSFIILSVTCKDRAAHQVPPVPKVSSTGVFDYEALNNQWKQWVNTDTLGRLYSEKAYKLFPQGELISGKEAITDYYRGTGIRIGEVYTDTVIMANEQKEHVYEIGGFLTEEGTPFKHLVIWNIAHERPVRELEFVAGTEYYSPAFDAIDRSRNTWIERCNQHNAGNLIETMYTPNAFYYNHKPMIVGREALSSEYSYMNNPDYKLSLTPLYTAQVSNSLFYEIGQCSGSYKGKYIIVWQKQPDGNWQVLFDSNK